MIAQTRGLCAAILFAALVLGALIPASTAQADGPKNCPNGICRVVAKKGGGGGGGGGGGNTAGDGGGGAKQSISSGTKSTGPSRLEMARKQQKAINRALSKYAAANKAYVSCVAAASSACTRPSAGVGGGAFSGAQVTLTGQPRPAGAPPAPTITPAQAGAMAVAQLQLPISTPGIGPDPGKNEWKMAAIGYPLWLWADGPTHIGPVGQNVGGLSVSLNARLSKTAFRMGDGKSVTCTGAGTPYKSWVKPGAKSPQCGYIYEKPSLPSKKYRVVATTYWNVTWTVNGVSGVIQVPRQGSVELPVGELQAVIVR